MSSRKEEKDQAKLAREEAARQQAAAHSKAVRTRVIVGVVIVLAMAGIIFGTTMANKSSKAAAMPANTTAEGAFIVGKDTAPVKVDLWEDFQCPICKRYNTALDASLTKMIDAGQIQAKYHMASFIGPESVRAANAGACAANEGQFYPFYKELYANQPPENTGGYTLDQLIAFGKNVGLTSTTFQDCIRNDQYSNVVNMVAAALPGAGVSGTPSYQINGGSVIEASATNTPEAVLAQIEKIAGVKVTASPSPSSSATSSAPAATKVTPTPSKS